MPSKLLITGGTGLVGTQLTNVLRAQKYEVSLLTTSAIRAEAKDAYYWNLKDKYIDHRAFDGVDYIVHLAGAGVADKRWSPSRKKIIYDSRIQNTELLFEKSKDYGIKGIVAASAIGYYGSDTGDQKLNEKSTCGEGFLAKLVMDWEAAIDQFNGSMEQVTKIRVGMVLSPHGGALEKISKPFRLGLGATLGSGTQWMSWIHISDLIKMIQFSMDKSVSGVFNAVAPHPVTNKEFTLTLGKALNKPVWLPGIPGIVLKVALGELSQIVLGGNRVLPIGIKKEGFSFDYPYLDKALENLISNDEQGKRHNT